MPAVSIILPTFNRLHYLREAVSSIREQTFADWELVIADDGSDDATREYLHSLAKEGAVVRFLAHSGNPGAVRNAALEHARGEYVAFLDSDDLWEADKLAIQWAVLEANPTCGWSYSGYVLTDHTGLRSDNSPLWPRRIESGWIVEQLVEMEIAIATPSVMVRRELLRKIGGFDTDLVACEDYDLFLRLASRSPAVAIDQLLVRVRRHREHHGNDLVAFEGRRAALGKLAATCAAEVGALIRAECAQVDGRIVCVHALAGDVRAAASAFVASLPRSWRYGAWWKHTLRACLYFGPDSLTNMLRSCRALFGSSRAL